MEVKIRKLDPQVVEALKAQAQLRECSLEEYLRQLMQDAAGGARSRIADEARRVREKIFRDHGRLPDSAALIREERDARG